MKIKNEKVIRKRKKKKAPFENPTKGILPGEDISDDLIDFCSNPENIQYFVETSPEFQDKVLSAKSTNEVSQVIYEIIKASAQSFPSTPKKDFNIPQDHIDGLYSIAQQMYEYGKYQDSADVFRLVLMLDRENYIYNFGLAACFQMLGSYRKALTTYMMAAFIEPENPMTHYHSAECHIKLGDSRSAIISLALVIKLAKDNPEYERLKERCKLTKTQLINQLKERKRRSCSKKSEHKVRKMKKVNKEK